jgi:DNA invertase Pin-like site-specific DNA recombinase
MTLNEEEGQMSRPSYSREQLAMVRGMLAKGTAITEVARATGLRRQAVYRIKADPVAAEASLTAWEQRPLAVALGRYRAQAPRKNP